MRENRLMIICITIIICIALICTTIIITNNQNNEKNMTVNNTPDNITNNTTTNNTTESTKTSTSNPKSSSTSSSEKVDSITTLDSSGKPITKKGVWVGRDEGGAHIYKDPDTGELFGKSGATYTGSKIYPK